MLERFAAHWSPPKMERWIMRIVPNQEATLGMLRTGELNFLALFTGDPRVLAELPKQAPAVQGGDGDRSRLPVPRLQQPPAAVRRPGLPPGAVHRRQPAAAGDGGL